MSTSKGASQISPTLVISPPAQPMTRSMAINYALLWVMDQYYGRERTQDYYAKLGLLTEFLTDMLPE